MKVKIVNGTAPTRATAYAAGWDLYSNMTATIKPGERKMITTGVFIELDVGQEGQVRPRSGLAVKHGVTIMNSPGTIDCDYRGEIKVCLINLGDTDFNVSPGDRIAQLVIAKYDNSTYETVNVLTDTSRGEKGFGSSGQ